jgi:hypothetical protein
VSAPGERAQPSRIAAIGAALFVALMPETRQDAPVLRPARPPVLGA